MPAKQLTLTARRRCWHSGGLQAHGQRRCGSGVKGRPGSWRPPILVERPRAKAAMLLWTGARSGTPAAQSAQPTMQLRRPGVLLGRRRWAPGGPAGTRPVAIRFQQCGEARQLEVADSESTAAGKDCDVAMGGGKFWHPSCSVIVRCWLLCCRSCCPQRWLQWRCWQSYC